MAVDATLLVRRLEELAGELATHRLLASQAESREAAEARALEAAHAEVVELRAAETTQRQRADAAERRAEDAAGQVEQLTEQLERQAGAGPKGEQRPSFWRRIAGAGSTPPERS